MQGWQLLSTLSMVSAIVQEAYDDGDYIISQGVIGSDFFVIEQGEVTATLKGDTSDTAMKEVSSTSATGLDVLAQVWRFECCCLLLLGKRSEAASACLCFQGLGFKKIAVACDKALLTPESEKQKGFSHSASACCAAALPPGAWAILC